MLRIFFLALVLLIGQTSVIAASIFNSEIVLDDSSSATEKLAKEKAFIDVLVKVSGQSKIDENIVIQKALPMVSQYITQLGYGHHGEQRSLVLGFDDIKIRMLLTQAQVTYWGLPRPEVLFWIVEDNASSRNIVWKKSGSPLLNKLKEHAARRGLPILIPVGDFDDVVAISIIDLWVGFMSPILEASMRYKPSGITVVKVHGNQVNWKLLPNVTSMDNDTLIEGHASGAPAVAFATMVNDISNFYAQRLGVTLGVDGTGTKQLNISGLNSAKDFFAAERTLKKLTSVAALRLESLVGDMATFRISLLASKEVFHNEMVSDRRIEATINSEECMLDVSASKVLDLTTELEVQTQVDVNNIISDNDTMTVAPVISTPSVEVEPALRYKWNG
ncbi:DUF2066 domain-containing protein [Candidatus Enterovibrio altilux]|uniref:DUF2066 domain-containing protein n=1 Tax=Candidatus Enterovibrio altilux TaxID=1927128 RepID=A0A291B782_9GAMM|nr:DUF2066 domain-containing protein [Candidatus Enterovibrio luxaltus]ATF08847.1 hypothetical protein BTN50_0310 [Candidatus Enterovibrio luxaltus]